MPLATGQATAGHQTLTSRAHAWQKEVCKHNCVPLKLEDSFLDRLIRPNHSNRSRRWWTGFSVWIGACCGPTGLAAILHPQRHFFPLLCPVLGIGLLRQSETFWTHIICSCEHQLREAYLMDYTYTSSKYHCFISSLHGSEQIMLANWVFPTPRKEARKRKINGSFLPTPSYGVNSSLLRCCEVIMLKYQLGHVTCLLKPPQRYLILHTA